MLKQLVGKVEDFEEESISLNYLRPDCQQIVDELSFPVPQGESLKKKVCTQTYGEAGRVFVGAQPDLNILMDSIKKISRKRD